MTASHGYASPGTYAVSLTVTDNGSFTATAYRDIVVQAPSAPAATIEVWLLVVLAIAVLGAAFLLWWTGRRRASRGPPPPPTAPPGPPSGPKP